MKGKKIFALIMTMAISITSLVGCSTTDNGSSTNNSVADTVYKNGNIYTVDDENPTATAIAVKGDKLVYVGNDDEIEKYVGKDTEVVDLEKGTVLPGLIEGHMQFHQVGERLIMLDGFEKSKEDILAAVKAEADKLEDGEWIIGRGWNQELWENSEFPSKEDLDAVAPNNPVMLTRACNHMIWVNSKALEIAGVTNDTPNPPNGDILKDKNGNVLGVLAESAKDLVKNKVPAYSPERSKEALLKGQEEMVSYGITSAHNAGVPTMDALQEIKGLYEDGSLKVRLYNSAKAEYADEVYKVGPEVGLYDNKYSCKAIKAYTDGSLGARTAWLLEDYADEAGTKGSAVYSDDEIYGIVKKARENEFQLVYHAIGDAGVNQLLNTYEKVLKESPLEDHRYRSEHFQVVNPDLIKKAADLGVVPSMQSVHATSDKDMAEVRLGDERIKGAYAWRSVLNSGMNIVNGSDAPVESLNPYEGLYAAVTRMDKSGNPEGGWYPDETMTREEALKSFTIWAAYGQFEEDLKGSLEAGKLADFVVVDKDYMKCDDSEIKDIKVVKTFIGGEEVYSAK